MRRTLSLAVTLACLVAGVVAVSLPSSEQASTIGGPFELTDAKSQRPFSYRELRGRPAALFFGFTSCPDVCPTALSHASSWLKALGPDGDRIQFVFVSVDPERDTAVRMAQYLSAFDPRIVGLTGTRTEVDHVIASYKIVAQKRQTAADEYSYDHTALIQLFDGRGVFQGTLDFDAAQPNALARLRALIHGPS